MSSASALTSLYQEDLYQIPSRVLFVISQPWNTFSEGEVTVLTKMIGALKLSPAQVQIVHLPQFNLSDLQAYAPDKVIALGATVASVSKTYEHIKVGDVSVIVADGLPQLDDLKKKNLWQALKQMFGI